MVSVPEKERSETLERAMETDSFTEVGDTSTDDYIHVQVGGGRREPTPVIVTPTRLRQNIKATGKDTGVVRDAALRRSQLPKSVTPSQVSDDDPFLSEPLAISNGTTQQPRIILPTSGNAKATVHNEGPESMRHNRDTTTANEETPRPPRRASTKEPNPDPPGVASSGMSVCQPIKSHLAPSAALDKLGFEPVSFGVIPPPQALNYQPIKPHLAPSAALDKLGFEPVSFGVIPPPQASKHVSSAKIAPPMPDLFTPAGSPSHRGTSAVPHEPFNLKKVDTFNANGSRTASSPSPGDTPVIPAADSDLDKVDMFDTNGEEPSAVGRIADATLEILSEGYDEIDEMFRKLAARVKMPFHQVSDRYIRQRSRTNADNLWNIYSMYFTQNKEDELGRLPKKERDAIVGFPTPRVRQRCFDKFKDKLQDKYIDFLETWKEARELANMGGTLAQRQQLFDKSKKNIDNSFTSLSKAHGFEGAYLLAGRVVNQDGGLGHVFTTPGAAKFFEERCRAGDDEIIAHFKAHIYNQTSLQAINEVFDSTKTAEKKNVISDVEEIDDPMAQTSNDASEERNDAEHLKKRLRTLLEEKHGQMSVSGKLFPWKQMPPRLARAGLVIFNWPEEVMLPGEEHTTRTMSKGISDLTRSERSQLLSAMDDKTDSRLHIRYVPDRKADLLSSREPVIIGAAPPHDSKQSRGKRIFYNLNIDRQGPQRLVNKAATRVKKKTSAASSTQVTAVDLDSDVPNDTNEVPLQKHTRTNPSRRNLARVVIQSKKKQRSVISLSSDNISGSGSDYLPEERNGRKGNIAEDKDPHDTVNSDYEEASPSGKRKAKVTATSRKLKIFIADDSDDEQQLAEQPAKRSLMGGSRRSKRRIASSPVAIISSDETSVPRETVVRPTSPAAPVQLPPKQHVQPSAKGSVQPSTAHCKPSSPEPMPRETVMRTTSPAAPVQPLPKQCAQPSAKGCTRPPSLAENEHPVEYPQPRQTGAQQSAEPCNEHSSIDHPRPPQPTAAACMDHGARLSTDHCMQRSTERHPPLCPEPRSGHPIAKPPHNSVLASTNDATMKEVNQERSKPTEARITERCGPTDNAVNPHMQPSGPVTEHASVPEVEMAAAPNADPHVRPSESVMTRASVPEVEMAAVPDANSHVQPSGPVMEQTFVSEVEMVAAPGTADQKGLEVSPNPPGGTRMLLPQTGHPGAESNHPEYQHQRPKPRLVQKVAGRTQQNNTEDAFNLRSRYYPASIPTVNTTDTLLAASSVPCVVAEGGPPRNELGSHIPSATDVTATPSSVSVQLAAAEEGRIGRTQESGCSHDMPDSGEEPGKAGHSPHPPLPAYYDAANPFARPPPVPERNLDRLPGAGVHPVYAQQPGVNQVDSRMPYDFNNNTSWYTSPQGPYAPMPYIPQHYRLLFPPPNLRDGNNGPLRYHDNYRPSMSNNGNPYCPTYQEPPYYLHPSYPQMAHAGPVARPDGDGNPTPTDANQPQHNPAGSREGPAKDDTHT